MRKVAAKARRKTIDQKAHAMDRDAEQEALIAAPHSGATQFSRSNCELRAGVLVQRPRTREQRHGIDTKYLTLHSLSCGTSQKWLANRWRLICDFKNLIYYHHQ